MEDSPFFDGISILIQTLVCPEPIHHIPKSLQLNRRMQISFFVVKHDRLSNRSHLVKDKLRITLHTGWHELIFLRVISAYSPLSSHHGTKEGGGIRMPLHSKRCTISSNATIREAREEKKSAHAKNGSAKQKRNKYCEKCTEKARKDIISSFAAA